MKTNKVNFKKLLRLNQNGVGLLLVMSSIALLTFLIATFTYNTSLNKIKVYNEQESFQARLTAEAGLNFALSKLKLYKTAFNGLQKNESLKSIISPEKLESIITQPFVYPIPVNMNKLNLIQKTLINDFIKNTVIEGEMIVEIQSISNFLNPNNLAVPFIETKTNDEDKDPSVDDNSSDSSTGADPEDDEEKKPEENSPTKDKNEILMNNEKTFIEMLSNEIQKKIEEDEEFSSAYSDVDPTLLIKELKFFVSRDELFKDDQRTDIEILYSEKNISPKHAPLEHIDELYLLAGWDDNLINLIKDKLSVYAAAIIPLNEINEKHLKMIFPELTEQQVKDFFLQRDGSKELEIDPTPLNSFEDFKKLCTETLDFDTTMFKDRTDLFIKSGYQFGPAGKLFKVTATGKYRNAVYTITAYVDLPILPRPAPTAKKSKKNSKSKSKTTSPSDIKSKNTATSNSAAQKTTIELMEPRAIYISY